MNLRKIKELITLVLKCIPQVLWPERCPFCERIHKGGICRECRSVLKKLTVTEPRCMKCGKPVNHFQQEYCHDCTHTYHHYERGAGLWLHREPVNASIYRFKYHNQRIYAGYYARELAIEYAEMVAGWKINVIIPIPLHSRRRRKRGYNQAELLADKLGELLGIPAETGCLKRTRDTAPLKKMDDRRRRDNIRGAFSVEGRIRPGVRVLLVDDIYTTGSTIDAASEALKEAGAEKVYFLTISIGQGY